MALRRSLVGLAAFFEGGTLPVQVRELRAFLHRDLTTLCSSGGALLRSDGSCRALAPPSWAAAAAPTAAPRRFQQLVSLRAFRGSPGATVALGVVDQLHDEVAIALPAEGRHRHFWEVLEFRADQVRCQ